MLQCPLSGTFFISSPVEVISPLAAQRGIDVVLNLSDAAGGQLGTGKIFFPGSSLEKK